MTAELASGFRDLTDDELESRIIWADANRDRAPYTQQRDTLHAERDRRHQLADELVGRSGQRYRSLTLADYTIRLCSPTGHQDEWYITPMGSSAHGRYTARERDFLDTARYERLIGT